MIVSSEIILLGDGLVFAHESSKPIESNHTVFRMFCRDLSARSATHLQLLPLKLEIVGKELCEV